MMPKSVKVQAHLRRRTTIREKAEEVRVGKRGGYTYTKMFHFDVDDKASMERVYDILGNHIMYVIATTNRPLEHSLPPGTPKTAHGIGLWRYGDFGPKPQVWADEVDLYFDIPEREALRLGALYKQKSILKVHGGHRHSNFLTVYGSGRTQRRIPMAESMGDVPSSVYVRAGAIREATR